MGPAMTETTLAIENARYRGTGAVSEENRCRGFRAAFMDRETRAVHIVRFADGRTAPCHVLDGLPAELVLARDAVGRVKRVKASVVSGFVRDGRFYTREEAAALLVPDSDAAPLGALAYA